MDFSDTFSVYPQFCIYEGGDDMDIPPTKTLFFIILLNAYLFLFQYYTFTF